MNENHLVCKSVINVMQTSKVWVLIKATIITGWDEVENRNEIRRDKAINIFISKEISEDSLSKNINFGSFC
jgi:hypothetical protein